MRINELRPVEYSCPLSRIKGTKSTAHFHAFAQEDAGDGISPVAIIELPDGSVKAVYVEHIRFTDRKA